ncbi:Mitochondrial import inner membrane translocase subunit tim17 [Colletotrichum siamense]|uniref:Mitochondrial import inner membrane translocase subunit tim17 n=1 Tax=Colletotrichum siamense TaxID=690259 RepID=UPI001872A391|nr:Mitochondrial import inner membrane translocase subunit tim17 [Colletotrichum siamense]KAF5487143.1 Mitochondrial import inner membrane translocase subunit tim17 [Colletotrichum siamense]
MDHTRDPCPWVILNDFGGAFAMGAIGGTLWHGIKGFRNSPYGERRIGAISAIKMRAPVLGGNFGVWGGLFSTFDCAVKGIRRKEDPYNAIIAGFFTGGSLAIRGGYKVSLFPSAMNRPPSAPQGHIAKAYQLLAFSATLAGTFSTALSSTVPGGLMVFPANGAIGCAVLLAVIEGVGIGFQKMFAGSTKLEASKMPQPPPSDGAMV